MKTSILVFLACAQLAWSVPLSPASLPVPAAGSGTNWAAVPAPASEDTALLIEFDRMFNQLHYDIDYRLRIYRMSHSLAVKNLNAQFISRYAFVITDIQHTKQRAKDAILEHALDVIGDTQNPCIVAANDEAIRRATQAARDLSIVGEETYGDLAILTRILVRPYLAIFQNTSSEFQWVVTNKLGRDNAVVHIQETLADLAFHWIANRDMLNTVSFVMDNELHAFQVWINELRRRVFANTDEIARNYIFNMEQLIEEALECS